MDQFHWFAAVLIVFIIGIALHIGYVARKVYRELLATYGEAVRYGYVSFDGQESLGGRQWRGLSLLWLTRSEIVLVRLVPRKKFVIPLDAVLDVYPSRIYNGGFFILPWLCIRYIREDGQRDVIGCMVFNYSKWAQAIRSLR